MDHTTYVSEESAHRHMSGCWWDSEQARWACPVTAPAAGTAQPQHAGPLVDVRDMVVVHTALLREFRLVPQAVTRVPPGAAELANRVDRHLGLLCDLLHHHHTGEDRLLWPVLRPRLPATAIALLEEAEAQHAAIDEALSQVGTARRNWVKNMDIANRRELAGALRILHGLLAQHLDTEERTLLPLAATHLNEGEWRAVGEAGAAAIPKSQMLLVFGMFAYEGDPEVLKAMLHAAPAPVRLRVPRIAPRIYARRASKVYGTTHP